jgi:hypothetical protein
VLYAAFISYSHAADGLFASVFQRALERIGVPRICLKCSPGISGL